MAIDTYRNMVGGLESPARNAVEIAPNDSADLIKTTRSIYVGTAGDVAVNMAGSEELVIFKSVPVGVLPVRVDRVLATNTTASDLIALW